MSKKVELAKNTMIIGFGKLVSQFISFLLLPLYTFFLTPEEYGAVDLILTYIILLAPLLILQLDRAAFRYMIDARGDDTKTRMIITSTLAAILVTITPIMAVYGGIVIMADIPFALLIAGAVVASMAIMLFQQFARGFGRNDLYTIANIITGLVMLCLTLWFVIGLKLGAAGVLWAYIVANGAGAMYLFGVLKLYKYIHPSARNRDVQRQLVGFAWPLIPSAISWWFIRSSDRTIVTIFLGVAANGVYAAANKYAMIFNALYSIFDLSWTESASAHINSRDRDKFFSDVYNSSFRLFGALGLGMISVTPFIFSWFIGSQFKEAYLYIPILVVGALLQAMVAQYSVIYIAKKFTKEVLVTSIGAAIISVTLNLVLIHFIGIFAAALSSAVAFLVMAIWRHYDIKKYVKITFHGAIFVKLGILYAIVGTMYYSNNIYLNLIGLVIAFGASVLLTKDIVLPLLTRVGRRVFHR